jgi:hypothetical protein
MMPDSALAATERQFFPPHRPKQSDRPILRSPLQSRGLAPQGRGPGPHPAVLPALRAHPGGRLGCPHHHRRQCHPARPLERGFLGAPDRGRGLGHGARHLHPLFLPRHPCRSPVSVWPATLWTAAQAVGVYPHRVVDRAHPLVASVNTLFDVPHSVSTRSTDGSLTRPGCGFWRRATRRACIWRSARMAFAWSSFRGIRSTTPSPSSRSTSARSGDLSPASGGITPPFRRIPSGCGTAPSWRSTASGFSPPLTAVRPPPVPGGAHRPLPRQYLARYGGRGDG